MKRLSVLWCVGLVAGAALLNAGTATAQSSDVGQPGQVSVSVHGATLGIGADVAVRVHAHADVRAGFNFFSLSHDFDTDGITLAAQLKLRSFQASFDWYPFSGSFHISPGLMAYNDNQVTASASVPKGQKFSLNDTTYYSDPNNPVTGSFQATFAKAAPSLLIGWGNIVPAGQKHWSVPFELGVVFSRAPTASLALAGGACTTQGAVNCPTIQNTPGLQANVQAKQDDINSSLSKIPVLPVMSVGFSYRF